MAELDESPSNALPSSSPPTSPYLSPVISFQGNDETITDDFHLESFNNESLNEVMPRPSLKRLRSDEDADTVTWSFSSTSGFSLALIHCLLQTISTSNPAASSIQDDVGTNDQYSTKRLVSWKGLFSLFES